MLDTYTQVIVDEFRKHEAFAERARKWLADADTQSLSASEREAYLAKSIQATCLLSMMKVRAPDFAHSILLRAFDEIDWQEAAKALYFVKPELN
jgi:hypothetical protein